MPRIAVIRRAVERLPALIGLTAWLAVLAMLGLFALVRWSHA